jgi:hypothetical protein
MKRIEVQIVDSEKVKSKYIYELLQEFGVCKDTFDVQDAVNGGKIKLNGTIPKFWDVFRFVTVKPGMEVVAGNKRVIVE